MTFGLAFYWLKFPISKETTTSLPQDTPPLQMDSHFKRADLF
jgi:hypothetical protein